MRLWREDGVSDGRRLGLSGLETVMVMRCGLEDTDLNQTVLFGITLCPTSLEAGSLGGITLDCSNLEFMILGCSTRTF